MDSELPGPEAYVALRRACVFFCYWSL